MEDTGERQVQKKGVPFDVQRNFDVAECAINEALNCQLYGSGHHNRHWGGGNLGYGDVGIRT